MTRILLVDDHAAARRALRCYLEELGYQCEEAEHGAAALAWLEEGHPVDLVITDNQMPIMDGLTFLKTFATRATRKNLRVLLYSGNLTEELEREALQAGAYAVLAKPYKFHDLVVTLSRALDQP